MFTGLVEDIGTVVRVDRRSDAAVLVIEPGSFRASELATGESIAVDGVCLTVSEGAGTTFTVQLPAASLEEQAARGRG